MITKNKIADYSNIKLWLSFGIVVSIVFSRLNINSIFIVLLLAAWLFEGNLRKKFDLVKKDWLFISYFLYFFIELIGYFLSPSFHGWKYLESQAGFLVVPLIFCSYPFLTRQTRNKILMVFSISLLIASLYCLIVAAWRFSITSDSASFFYHELVSPLQHHAIYFSVYTFISIVFLLTEVLEFKSRHGTRWLILLWAAYNFIFLILLSSKMVILILLLFLPYYVISRAYKKQKKKLALSLILVAGIVIAIFLTVDNPVKRRFEDLFAGNLSIVKSDKYNPGMWFNGFEFRVLLWRFTYEILNEKKAWLTGVGPVNAQPDLKEKYLDMNMYAGDKNKGDPGYLDYNCHNQLLQSTLQYGIPGLLTFVFLIFTLFITMIKKREIQMSWLIIIILCFIMTESVFERQYGMILCTFFPLLFFVST